MILIELQNKLEMILRRNFLFSTRSLAVIPFLASLANAKCGIAGRMMKSLELTITIKELGNVPIRVGEEQLDMLAYYIKKFYSPKAKELKPTLALERWSKSKASPNNDLRQIPMSHPALHQHTKRACYQAGYLWNECLHNVGVPDPLLWGWMKDRNEEFIPCWQIVNTPRTVDSVISTCTYKSTSCQSCECARSVIPCLPFCICRRAWNNKQ